MTTRVNCQFPGEPHRLLEVRQSVIPINATAIVRIAKKTNTERQTSPEIRW